MKYIFLILLSVAHLSAYAMLGDPKILQRHFDKAAQPDATYERENVCGIELHLKQGSNSQAYLLSCSQAKEFMKKLLQGTDASSHSVTTLKMRGYTKLTKYICRDCRAYLCYDCENNQATITREIVKDMPVQEAANEIDNFSDKL